MNLGAMKRVGLRSALSLGALVATCAIATPVQAKSGGGLVIEGDGVARGHSGGAFGVGGEGVLYLGPFLRGGVDAQILATSRGTGGKGGFFGDFVFGHVANADIFLGVGLGLGGGEPFGGGSLYARPEFGVQWNLGQIAVEARLHATLMAPISSSADPGTMGGISVGLLFGDFQPGGGFNRGGGRGRYREEPRQPRYAPPPPPPARYEPPPPPPPRY